MKDKKGTYQGTQNADVSRVHDSMFVVPGVGNGNGGVVMEMVVVAAVHIFYLL